LHLTVSLSSKIHTSSFESPDVPNAGQHHLASDTRIHASVDQLTRPHLDVESDFLIDLLSERHTPEPRSK
jgi:hypothetical protein